MTTTLKQAFDARGMKMADLCGVPGLCYPLARRHYVGQRRLTAEYALKYEALFGIPRSELRPDLWPPKQEQEKPDTHPIGWSCEEL